MKPLVDVSDPSHSNHVISCDGRTVERIWTPEVPILESVRNELLQIAESHLFECCGFIDSEWNVWKIPNIHKSPTSNYYMDEAEAESVLEHIYSTRQEHVTIQWHTHPNGAVWPSPRDIRGWPNPRMGWRYIIVTPKEIVEWGLA